MLVGEMTEGEIELLVQCKTQFDIVKMERDNLKKEVDTLRDYLKTILKFKGPEYVMHKDGQVYSIFQLVREALDQERIQAFHAGYSSKPPPPPSKITIPRI